LRKCATALHTAPKPRCGPIFSMAPLWKYENIPLADPGSLRPLKYCLADLNLAYVSSIAKTSTNNKKTNTYLYKEMFRTNVLYVYGMHITCEVQHSTKITGSELAILNFTQARAVMSY